MQRCIITLLLTVIAASAAHGGTTTSHLLPLQGQAADSTGTPLVVADLRVRVYDAAVAGTLVFDSSTEFIGAIQDGIFDVVLGSVTPLDLDNTLLHHLEIDIEGEEVIGDVNGGRYAFYPGGGSHDRSDLESRLDSLETELGVTAARPPRIPLAPAFPGSSAGYRLAYGLLGIGRAQGASSNYDLEGHLLLQPVGEFSSMNYCLGLGPFRLIEEQAELVVLTVQDTIAPATSGSVTVAVHDVLGERVSGISNEISLTSHQGLVVPDGSPVQNPDTTYTFGFDGGPNPGLDTLVVQATPGTAALTKTVPIRLTYFPHTVLLTAAPPSRVHPGESVVLTAAILDSIGRHVPDELTGLAITSLIGCGTLGSAVTQSDSSYTVTYTAGGALCQDEVELFDAEASTSPRDTISIEVTDRAIITSVLDVGNDQGRQVRVIWKHDLHDTLGAFPAITEYVVWRRVDSLPGPAQAFSLAAYHRSLLTTEPLSEGLLMLAEALWEPVGPTVPTLLWTTYANVVPTLADSNFVQGIHYSVFFVSAHTSDPQTFFSSEPDSGFSIDNLAPGAPQNLALSSPGILSWDEAPESDFDYFTAYGSSSPSFDESAVVIGTTVLPALDVSASPLEWYFVTATDFNGNESSEASILNTVSVPDGNLPRHLALHQCWPNPLRTGTTISFDLPSAERVRLEVFDANGRLAATLADREFERGHHALSWSGRDDGNQLVPAGVYFYRLSQRHGETRTRKLVVLR